MSILRDEATQKLETIRLFEQTTVVTDYRICESGYFWSKTVAFSEKMLDKLLSLCYYVDEQREKRCNGGH